MDLKFACWCAGAEDEEADRSVPDTSRAGQRLLSIQHGITGLACIAVATALAL